MPNIDNSGIYNIYVDFDKMYINNYTRVIFNKLDYKTSKIRVYFIKNGEKLDLTDSKVDIKIMKPNYELVTNLVSSTNISEGYVDYIFNNEELIYGIGYFQIRITKDSKVKITPKIRYKVIK